MITLQTSTQTPEVLLQDDKLLGLISFAAAPQARPQDPRHIITPLAPLTPGLEVWTSSTPVTTGRHGNIHYSANNEVLLGSLILEDHGQDLAQLSHQIYQELLSWLPEQTHSHLWRVWNIFPAITEGDGDNERYRAFCRGRHRAFTESARQPKHYPAATAIGCAAPQLFIMFLAGKQPSRQIENPRQQSAYHYPRQYGPRSPQFSRAAMIASGTATDQTSLLVSGTASIVGHLSHHPDDWEAQLEETNKNLDTLIQHTGLQLRSQVLRVYLRAGIPSAPVIEQLKSRWGQNLNILALQGDICRRELLLEIEGVWQDTSAA
jgi:chorismate lyase/3-hydroxybenzoate synthase